MDVRIIAQKGSHFLIARGDRCAVVEQRNNRFYNCHGVARRGIAAERLSAVDRIIDDTDWVDEPTARALFNDIAARGTDLAEHMR